jgi:hypothetical protein
VVPWTSRSRAAIIVAHSRAGRSVGQFSAWVRSNCALQFFRSVAPLDHALECSVGPNSRQMARRCEDYGARPLWRRFVFIAASPRLPISRNHTISREYTTTRG